jgi:hypothetical protein
MKLPLKFTKICNVTDYSMALTNTTEFKGFYGKNSVFVFYLLLTCHIRYLCSDCN